jgi:hypothetical protein
VRDIGRDPGLKPPGLGPRRHSRAHTNEPTSPRVVRESSRSMASPAPSPHVRQVDGVHPPPPRVEDVKIWRKVRN